MRDFKKFVTKPEVPDEQTNAFLQSESPALLSIPEGEEGLTSRLRLPTVGPQPPSQLRVPAPPLPGPSRAWRRRGSAMAAAVERRLAQFRAARGRATAAPHPAEPPGKAAAPEAAEGPRADAEGPGGSAQVRPGAAAAPVWARPLLLKVLLWAVLLALFAELELGLPYFVLSLLYWMYAGTRGPAERRPGELSAYSVFNPGCAAIAGTLTAEQLERELHYRPAAGR
ncbi:SAYSvFN domain-containing protein 1 [Pyrgilauda ruficollis]|uniref:SAYSvFN domain-containing protein 1 n=1 Tax=Pyrgilauda ruficollis TaxID=221976 RepID=UPI001B86C140|nr:SAYSvFN domain-containing protein 1 [Pyrgilauda ruficollis]